MLQKRDTWVDVIKIYACILVLSGHLFQGLVTADIIAGNSLYEWFNTTIYYFHVPLFFICSGFLHQKYSTIRTISQWKTSFAKKAVSLGIPYFVFSLATYALKVVFSGSVNSEVDGLFKTLFFKPLSPYWYLYVLIIIFFFAFTFKCKGEVALALVAAVTMKVVAYIPQFDIYILKVFCDNALWFVLGMLICYCDLPSKFRKINAIGAVIGTILFVGLSVIVYDLDSLYGVVPFAMGMLGCLSTLMVVIKFEKSFSESRVVSFAAKYTFPVFLMHTIFAAGFRSAMLKVGVSSSILHIIVGIIVSVVLPVIVAVVMSKFKWMEFFLYPNKIIKIGGRGDSKSA